MIDTFVMDRREMIARFALLLGATALPAQAFAAPKARFALLSAVVDTILPATDTPGAVAAGVPARLDGMLRDWASAETRTSVVGALGRIDASAKAAKQIGFTALSSADRTALLTAYDLAALKSVPPPSNPPPGNPYAPSFFVVDPGYLRLKDLAINLYYFSEIGSANELEYNHVPGKWQPSLKLTPQSRPYLGTGPF
jgi:Gluconate 2-dehydrogenase subunit 3